MAERRHRVETNSVVIKRLPKHDCYYQYDDIASQGAGARGTTSRRVKTRLFDRLQNTCAPSTFNPRMIYDSGKLAYCSQQLLFPAGNAGTFHVHPDSDTLVDPNTKGSYRIILTRTSSKDVQMSELKDLLQGRRSSPGALVAINLIQLILRQGPNKKYGTINGRAYLSNRSRDDYVDLDNGLALIRSIFISARPALGNMILTVDTSTTVVIKEGNLIDVCTRLLRVSNYRALKLLKDSPDFKKLERHLRHCRVKVTIPGSGRKPRTKIIQGLIPQAGFYEFSTDEHDTTVERFMRDVHGYKVLHPDIIGVSFSRRNSDREDVVPAELCHVEEGQVCKALPAEEDFRSKMIKFSTLRPDDKRNRIDREVKDYYAQSEYLMESGMVLEPTLLSIDAKLLNPPRLIYNGNIPKDPRDGAWNVTNVKLFEPKEIRCWAIVNFDYGVITEETCISKMQSLANCCIQLGIRMKKPDCILDGHPNRVTDTLEQALRKCRESSDFAVPMFIIIVLLPQEAGHIRRQVKHWGDVTRGIITQCLRRDKYANLRPGNSESQYFNNVALKINARLGGCNSHASTASSILKKLRQLCPFMIMGADVSHPGPGVQKPSVTSLVYSTDEYAARYRSISGIQQPRLEIIQDIRQFTKRAISSFVQINSSPNLTIVPQNIIFFRDGVSDGEYDRVASEEFDELKAAIDELWKEKNPPFPKPKVTFIIVTKRHHAVLFPRDSSIRDKKGNCNAGTVVDDGITSPIVRDFYLQSHAAIQGTSRSSHYVVLKDEVFGFNLGVVQQLAFELCHVYAKATRSVSIPAPVYYADRLCSRLEFHLDPAEDLQFSDSASTNSGDRSFDMEPWRRAFKESKLPVMHFL